MRKLIFILLLCLTTSVSAQFFAPHQKPMLGLQVNKGHPLGDPVAFYLFNEGTGNKVLDLSGNNNGGTLTGTAPSWGSDKYGSTIVFPGTDEHILIPNKAILKPSFPFTVVGRIKTNAENGYLFKSDFQGSYAGYMVQIHTTAPNKCVYLQLGDNAGGGAVNRNDYWLQYPIDIGQWYDIAVVFNAFDDRVVYVDGVGEAAVHSSGTAASMVYSSSNSAIGCNWGVFEDQEIAYVYIYNRALSASEIAQVTAEPFCMVGPSFNWCLYNAITVPTTGGQVIFIMN